MPKNIVVLSDGTGQDGGAGHDSNVYKLVERLKTVRTIRSFTMIKGWAPTKEKSAEVLLGWVSQKTLFNVIVLSLKTTRPGG